MNKKLSLSNLIVTTACFLLPQTIIAESIQEETLSSPVKIISSNIFQVYDQNVSFHYPFIVVSLKKNGLGYAYTVNDNGVITNRAIISGGSPKTPTPYGLFNVRYRKEFYMSKTYPSASGKNNMDDMINITPDGVALHKGSNKFYSHGCVHVSEKKSNIFFHFARRYMPVIITSDFYQKFNKTMDGKD